MAGRASPIPASESSRCFGCGHLMQRSSWLLWLGCLLLAGSASATAPLRTIEEVFAGRELQRERLSPNENLCYNALLLADRNSDREVDMTEYITFLNKFKSESLLPESLTTFEDLPTVLRSNFFVLACRCLSEPGAVDDCCTPEFAHISTLGAKVDETPTPEQRDNLFETCFLTESSYDIYENESPDTPAPIGPPTVAPVIPATPAPTMSPTSSPTPLPTDSPTIAASGVPTDPPTIAASGVPTDSPTKAPTAPPTESPTVDPSAAPTASPTATPTAMPSPAPTGDPSSSPTPDPTLSPTLSPTVEGAPTRTPTVSPAPTESPTVSPSVAPSKSQQPTETTPTLSPSASDTPTENTADIVVRTSYLISVSDTTVPLPVYELIAAMDILAPRVLVGLDFGRRVLRTSERRRLAVEVDIPTSIDGVFEIECPSGVSPESVCGDVGASIGLFLTEGEDKEVVEEVYQKAIEQGIESGALQVALLEVNRDTIITILTDDKEPLSGGAISGIVIGSMVGLIAALGFMSTRRSSRDPEEYYLKPDNEVNAVQEIGASGSPSGSKPQFSGMTALDAPHSPDRQDSDAGSSGWSSHGGLSSMDSLAEDSTRNEPLEGVPVGRGASRASGDSSLQMTYSELDQAIQKGDWAAVGVTAALLASQSNDSLTQKTPVEDTGKLTIRGDLNQARAAELDRLVEAGDWAGVVAAAAKYDSQGNSIASSPKVSSAGSSGESVGSSAAFSGSGTAFTAGSGIYTSTGTTASDSGSRMRKLVEIRAEVELLVDKVVPEEKDNIDEMMMQFRGREEELVETLRSMQEREVAQKARVEGQKRAKRDARQRVVTKNAYATMAVDNTGAPADDSWIREIDNAPPATGRLGIEELEPPKEEDEDREVKAMQKSLRKAIEEEDWEKVADIAAGLSGKNLDTSGDYDTDSQKGLPADRSQEINSLVEKEDWIGVAAAASRYNAISTDGGSKEEVRRKRRQKRMKEEQEALTQAGIWSAIAEQTKTEASKSQSEANKAASVAADWAIQRSLDQLNAAEEAGKLDSSDSDDDAKGKGGNADGGNDEDMI